MGGPGFVLPAPVLLCVRLVWWTGAVSGMQRATPCKCTSSRCHSAALQKDGALNSKRTSLTDSTASGLFS